MFIATFCNPCRLRALAALPNIGQSVTYSRQFFLSSVYCKSWCMYRAGASVGMLFQQATLLTAAIVPRTKDTSFFFILWAFFCRGYRRRRRSSEHLWPRAHHSLHDNDHYHHKYIKSWRDYQMKKEGRFTKCYMGLTLRHGNMPFYKRELGYFTLGYC